eukprot:scaffold41514_cov60-Phaeocystis_antarctica.AAC.3
MPPPPSPYPPSPFAPPPPPPFAPFNCVERGERDAAAVNGTGSGSAFGRAVCTLEVIGDALINDTWRSPCNKKGGWLPSAPPSPDDLSEDR